MNKQREQNKVAWNYRAKEFWSKELGDPKILAKNMTANPQYYIRKHQWELGNVKGVKILNPLGSCGKKAIPLAILGADVTVVDISNENREYALEVASHAKANLTYITGDFLDFTIGDSEKEFDIVYLEGGILHYFTNLNLLAVKIHKLMDAEGKLILNDFHPFRKVFKNRSVFDLNEEELVADGDYFENKLEYGEVAYEKFFDEEEREVFPKCLLRYWTMGEIITAFATAGFIIKKLEEGPRFDKYKNLPGEYTLIATKK